MSVQEKVVNIISEQLQVDKDKITPTLSLKDVGADSLAIMDLVLAVEDEFDLQLDESDQLNFNTVEDIIKFLEEKGK